jgi:hypothetical protein
MKKSGLEEKKSICSGIQARTGIKKPEVCNRYEKTFRQEVRT